MNARYQTDWVAAACGPLSVRMAQEPAEVQLLRDALNCGHSLKAGRPAGHVLWQGVYERDPECGLEQLVAVLCPRSLAPYSAILTGSGSSSQQPQSSARSSLVAAASSAAATVTRL